MILSVLLALFASTLASAAVAQPSAPTPLAVGDEPGEVADRAVDAWLAQPPIALSEIRTVEDACRTLPLQVLSPPPQRGTRVNLDDRRELDPEPNGAGANRRVFTYSAVRPNDQLEVVEVTVEADGDRWQAVSVGYRNDLAERGSRRFLQRPISSWVFIGFSLLVVYLLVTRSFLRRLLAQGREVIGEHRRLVFGTLIGLYTVFGLGVLFGTQLPPACGEAALAIIDSALTSVGATQALESGSVPRAATVIFYQNFVTVTLAVLYTFALMGGVPAYLLATASFFVQAIPFGLFGATIGVDLISLLVVLVLELTSYFLVVAGGGILLVTLIRKGFGALGEAFTRVTLMLPFALLFLLAGAWFEALVVIVRSGG